MASDAAANLSGFLHRLTLEMAAESLRGLSDQELVAKALADGDAAVFHVLVRRHGAMVYGVCWRVLRNEHDAEDAFQATFLVLAQKLRNLRKHASLASWLHGVARRIALKAQAQAAVRRRHERQAMVSESSPRHDPTRAELHALLDVELARLPDKWRLPLILCYLEGRTQDEAAAQLGLSKTTLRNRLEEGRQRLAARLTQRGVVWPAALYAVLLSDCIALSAPGLFAATIKAAANVAAGKTLALAASAEVAALTQGVLNTMFLNKIKTALAVAALTLTLATASFGLGFFPQGEANAPHQHGAVERAAEQRPPAVQPAPRADRYGDPLPPGAIARLGTVRFRVPNDGEALAFAPDGKTIAASSRGGLFLFAADTGKPFKRIEGGATADRPQNTPAFSPDGKCLAVWLAPGHYPAKEAVHVWEVAGAQKPVVYDADHLIWLGWSADNAPRAVCLEKDAVAMRELASGQVRRFKCANLHPPESSHRVLCALAPTGKTMVVVDAKYLVHVFDTDAGAERCIIAPDEGDLVFGLGLSADGRQVATLQRGREAPYPEAARLWNASTGEALRTIATDHENMSVVAFATDGKTLATAGWNGIRCWDTATGKERSRSEGEGSNTLKIAFSGDGQSVATLQRQSGAVHLWDVATGRRKAEPAGHTSRPHSLSFSPDGKRLVSGGGLDNSIHVWDLAKSASLFTIHRRGLVREVAFSRDGRSLFSSAAGDSLWISDAHTGERQHVIKLEDPDRPDTYQSAIDMRLSGDNTKLVVFSYYYAKKAGGGSNFGETFITGWDPATRKQMFRRRAPSSIWSAVSADAGFLASAYPKGDNMFLQPPGQGPMRLEDLATGKLLLKFPNPEGQLAPLAFSPDARLLASVNYKPRKQNEHSLRLWEVATTAEVLSLPLAGQCRAAFSPDGRFLALTAAERDLVVWDLAQGRELRRFKGFDTDVTDLAFSPDGRQLVSSLADSTLLVWDVGSPAPLRVGKLDAATLAKAWDDLAGSDAPRAFRARGTLLSDPDATLALIQKQLKPAQPADARQLQTLIIDLNSPQFPVRSAANKKLEEHGDLAAGALRQALAKTSSLEQRRRIETLLDKLGGTVTRPDAMRAVRATAILENLASPEARKLLATWAQGTPDARLTREAQAALQRLALR